MAPSLKIASLVAAVLLLLAIPQARGWAPEDDQVSDMVPVRMPAEQVLVAIPGGVGTMAGSPVCLQCRCCSRSAPGNCQMTTCCSSFNCNPAGKCNLVQGKCGCSGCGGAN
ncbi:hypothetical protein BAE44_0014290 [Dichanthelium oligosanthes]|uniref:Bowman-Birk serine protease inhibitors family domain-containing protein n=1 Tax=Dichanthelium oligosanthes TaxID=888268 RepID=A0A1E5VHU4_9POAL|nr:hypothetical protein BAE44_0014290 [Dichanthelium oligosanthes]